MNLVTSKATVRSTHDRTVRKEWGLARQLYYHRDEKRTLPVTLFGQNVVE